MLKKYGGIMNICGVYALFWPVSGMVYIGQSQTINKRFREHLACLSNNKHANYKVQAEFNLNGSPELIILDTCKIDDLYSKEVMWTNEFNSLAEGLNIVAPGPSGWGVNSNQSKYSKTQVLKVFSLLTTTDLANIDISNRLGVSLRLVEAIRNGYSHTWLKENYPERYAKLSNKPKIKSTVGRKLGKAIIFIHSKTHEVVEVSSVVDFTKYIYGYLDNAFASGIRRVIRGEQLTYRDWQIHQSVEAAT